MNLTKEYIEINYKERNEYLNTLINLFGNNCLNNELDLTSVYQNRIESIRHSINDKPIHLCNLNLDKWKPNHVLLILTHKCSLKCKHCYLFCNTNSNISLSKKVIDNIFDSKIGRTINSITVSGGEPFQSNNLFYILGKYPVKSLFTNLTWSFTAKQRDDKINLLIKSLNNNDFYNKGAFKLYVSIDEFHCKNNRYFKFINQTIELLLDNFPKLNIIISNTMVNNDNSLDLFFNSFREKGYQISKVDEHIDNNLIQTNYLFEKHNKKNKISIDKFPLSNISRTLLTQKKLHLNKNDSFIINEFDDNDSLCNYVISPDGRVALYDVFMVPPIPYHIGNFNIDIWENIIEKASCDPISICLRDKQYSEILNFYKAYYPKIFNSLTHYSSTINQLLYFLLLNSKNRLSLNNFLLNKCNSNNRNTKDSYLQETITKNKVEHQNNNNQLYKLTNNIFITDTIVTHYKNPVIIMDIHGVIFETTWLNELKDIYTEITGNNKNVDAWLAFNLYAKGKENRIKKLQEISGKSENDIKKTFDIVQNKYHNNKTPKLKKNVIQFLKAINNNKIQLYLISGSNKELIQSQLKKAGIIDLFEKRNIFGLNTNFEIKSNVKIEFIKTIIQKHPDNTIVIFEDWIENLDLLNCKNLLFFGMPQYQNELFIDNSRQLISNGADYILRNWDDWKVINSIILNN